MTPRCSYSRAVRSWSSRPLRFSSGSRQMWLTPDIYRRVADDLAGFDSNQYRISVVPSELGGRDRFHVGEVIRVKWRAPSNHSRKDWIGIYRVRACRV